MANEKPTSKPPSIGFHSSERSDRSKDMPPGPNWVRIAGIWTDATAPTREPTTTPEERARMAEAKRRQISLDRTIQTIAQEFSMVEKALSDHAGRTIRLKDKNRVDEAARPVYGYLEFVATEYGGLKPGDPPKHFVTKTMNMITFPKVDVVFPSFVEWLERMGGGYQAWFEIGEARQSAQEGEQEELLHDNSVHFHDDYALCGMRLDGKRYEWEFSGSQAKIIAYLDARRPHKVSTKTIAKHYDPATTKTRGSRWKLEDYFADKREVIGTLILKTNPPVKYHINPKLSISGPHS